jgi:hypothetical protein
MTEPDKDATIVDMPDDVTTWIDDVIRTAAVDKTHDCFRKKQESSLFGSQNDETSARTINCHARSSHQQRLFIGDKNRRKMALFFMIPSSVIHRPPHKSQ